jgi:hypothetical protein
MVKRIYGKNRGRVKRVGVLLGVYFNFTKINAFIIKAYREMLDTYQTIKINELQ